MVIRNQEAAIRLKKILAEIKFDSECCIGGGGVVIIKNRELLQWNSRYRTLRKRKDI